MAFLKSLLVVVIAAMVLSLSACGGEEEPPAETSEPEVRELTDEEILERLRQQRIERQETETERQERTPEQDEIERRDEREREERRRQETAERERRATASAGYSDFQSPEGEYTVQVAAHRNEYMARQSAEIWRDRGYNYTFIRQTGDFDTGDTWFKVYLGRYGSFTDADRVSLTVNNEYPRGSWPRPLPEGR